jgi:hypothetical protein
MGTFYQMPWQDLIQCHSGERISRSRDANLIKSKTFFMYHQLTFRNSLFCPQCINVLCVDLRTTIISLYSTNLSVFITEAENVYCAVRAGSLDLTDAVSSFKDCTYRAWYNQPYVHWNMNTTDVNHLHVSALLERHHQGVQILLCASERVSEWVSQWVSEWVSGPHIREQFEEHDFNRYKDSLMMALKKGRNKKDPVCLLCSYFSARTASLLHWIVVICFTVILTPIWLDHEKL